MSKIENLYAYNSEVPGEPVCFEVQGTVTVAHPGIEPVLVAPKIRHKGGWEVLQLKLEDKGGHQPAGPDPEAGILQARRRDFVEAAGDHSRRRFANGRDRPPGSTQLSLAGCCRPIRMSDST
ncbi:hypothetical protein OGV25_26585 [Pseudomonas sp. P1B16]|uniref:hypothetical protein n=1 Tax=Pseudomonas sp. P1B16 TaxID=2986074 RepID=UPI002A23C911|nr:hypothetical protein [Pseudomonas sp. P1B16]WPM26586.1 hypothetical protein OGV25_26585 [Pseudomonas sp. P1B16]